MRKPASYLGVMLLALALARESVAQDATWLVRDAPYRAAIKLNQPPKSPEAGIAIELPDFGQSRPDLADALLVDDKGQMQPLAAVWRGEGQWDLLLAKELNAGTNYYLYFGGNAVRSMQSQSWAPKLSLLMETRRFPAGA